MDQLTSSKKGLNNLNTRCSKTKYLYAFKFCLVLSKVVELFGVSFFLLAILAVFWVKRGVVRCGPVS